jgi:hypothetical protein
MINIISCQQDKIMVVDHHSNSCMSCKENVCFTSAQKVMHKNTKHGFGVLQVWFQIHVANGTTRL